jgi:muconolactone delta-isomerase
MAQFMNSFTWNQAPDDEFYSLMPLEQENVRRLMAEGKMLHLFVAEDNSGGWAVHSGESLEEVLALIETMPLRKFMNIDVKQLADM